MSSSIHISPAAFLRGEATQLPSSKSISNRVLILKALSGNQSVVSNLSVARDTRLMTSLIDNPDKVIDVMDAGTTMRFLTAYFAVTGKNKILTGTDRMKERPIRLLVDALRAMGATVDYLEKEGFPPIETKGFTGQRADSVTIPGDVSSQYISALMMVAPILTNGLTINLTGKIGSRPYIDMTASLMRQFGVSPEFNDQVIDIPHATYRETVITVEADWSAASYWFAFTALAEEAEITLPNVSAKSLQGDRVIAAIMEKLGVRTVFRDTVAVLRKQDSVSSLTWDFTDCPDLAQTVFPVCAVKGISGLFTGLESLRIKETDRIAAMQRELGKINASLTEETPGHWRLNPGELPQSVNIQTYHDHRMAMGFAPLATRMNVVMEEPEVTNKSYPGFWDDMKSVGFTINPHKD